jgi:hypothetical protein
MPTHRPSDILLFVIDFCRSHTFKFSITAGSFNFWQTEISFTLLNKINDIIIVAYYHVPCCKATFTVKRNITLEREVSRGHRLYVWTRHGNDL